jgi:hypothetical protein
MMRNRGVAMINVVIDVGKPERDFRAPKGHLARSGPFGKLPALAAVCPNGR